MRPVWGERGFTFFEVLVTIGIFSLVGGLALLVSMESYRGSYFRSDRDLLIAALQHARSQAMSNICVGACTDGKPHGVHIEAEKYVIFQGASYDADDPSNAVFAAQAALVRGGGDIVFSQLSGTTTATTTTLKDDAGRESVISVSADGQITWTH